MSNFPASWSNAGASEHLLMKITNLLNKFGPLDGNPAVVSASTPITASAIFVSAAHAKQAAKALHNVDNRTEAEKKKNNHAPPKDSERFCVRLLSELRATGGAAAATPPSAGPAPSARVPVRAPAAAAAASPTGARGRQEVPTGTPLLVYVDELRLSEGVPSKDHREIYLRDLPLDDYDEKELKEWLLSFGTAEDITFLKDPETKELTGKGYVRFRSHEEAGILIDAFPAEDEEGNVQGSWSLSERLLPRLAEVAAYLAPQLQIAVLALPGCTALRLEGGDGAVPLRFAAYPRDRQKVDQAMLRERLRSLLDAAMKYLAEVRPAPSAAVTAAAAPARAAAALARAAPEAAATEAPGLPLEEDLPKVPCIVVTGFPASWKEEQVKLVFAVFGGVAAARFALDASGRRVAHVELKVPENMSKAAESLHDTRVGDGDFIEECTITCELRRSGGESRAATSAVRRVLFVDELPMPKRPEVQPSLKEREVFLSSLPVEDTSESQIKDFLEGFGQVEDMLLLQDPLTGTLSGKGYARFKTHEQAALCIEQTTADAEDEGDVVAAWSESERAACREAGVYGVDVHSAFAGPSGRVLSSILASAKLKAADLWMFSELFSTRERGAPEPAGNRLHFVAVCTDQQFDLLQAALAAALEAFHEKTVRRLREAKEAEREARAQREAMEARSRREAREAREAPRQPSPPRGWHLPPGAPVQGPPPGSWPPPTYGQHPPLQRPPGWFYPAHAMPPVAPSALYGAPPGWPHPHSGPLVPRGPVPLSAPAPAAAAGPTAAAESHRRGEKRSAPDRDRSRERSQAFDDLTQDSALRGRLKRAEACIVEGEGSVARGEVQKAYEKYTKGLGHFMEVLPKLEQTSPAVLEFRTRIHALMEEAEKLKRQLTLAAQQPPSQPPAASAPPAPMPRAASSRGPRRRRRRDGGDGADADEHTNGGGGGGHEPRAAAAEYSGRRIGEKLIAEALELEAQGQLSEAYEKYCAGLKQLVTVLSQIEQGLERGDSEDIKLQAARYLEQAEKLKERLETRPASDGEAADEPPREVSPLSRHEQHRGGGGQSGGAGVPASAAGGAAVNLRRRVRHRDGERSRSRSHRRGALPRAPPQRPSTDAPRLVERRDEPRRDERRPAERGDRRGHGDVRDGGRDGGRGHGDVRLAPQESGRRHHGDIDGGRRNGRSREGKSGGRGDGGANIHDREREPKSQVKATRTKAPPGVPPASVGGPMLRAKSGFPLRPP